MGIIEFYTRVLKSLDVEVEDGYLKIPDGDSLISYTNNGIPLVLPEKHHISTLLSEDDNGKIIAVKQLFNVLDETVIRGDSVSLSKLKKLVKVRLSNRLNIIGKLLLMTAENKALQTKTPMLVNQFLMRLTEADNPNIKKIVDDGTIERWCKLYDSSFETNNLGFISIYVKKGGKIGSTKYNRVTTIKCPIYEELCVLEKGGRINGINLRNKDVTVFKILFEYLIEGISANGIITTGSNNK